MVEKSRIYSIIEKNCRIIPQLCNAPSSSTRMESMHGIAQYLFNNGIQQGNIVISPYIIGHRVDIMIDLHNLYNTKLYTGIGKRLVGEDLTHKVINDPNISKFVQNLMMKKELMCSKVIIEATITPYSALSTDFPFDCSVLARFPKVEHKILHHKGKFDNSMLDTSVICSQNVNINDLRLMPQWDFNSTFISQRLKNSLFRMMSTSIFNPTSQIELDTPFNKVYSDNIEIYPTHILAYMFDSDDVLLADHTSNIITGTQTIPFTKVINIPSLITRDSPHSSYHIDRSKCDQIDQMADVIYNVNSVYGGIRIDISADRLPLEVPKSFLIRSSKLVENMLGCPFSKLDPSKVYDMTDPIRTFNRTQRVSAVEAIGRLQHLTDNLIINPEPDAITTCKWLWATYNNVHINGVPIFV